MRTGKRELPPRIFLYGPHKVGKSTFAANIPRAVFLPFEEGLDAIEVDAFWQDRPGKRATSLQDVWDAIYLLKTEQHEYEAVVLDTVDWLEPLIWADVCQLAGKPDIEAFGFQKGYAKALETWQRITKELDALRVTRGVSIVLLGHAVAKRHESPDVEPFDQWQPRLHKHATSHLCEWSDIIGYADIETKARTVDEKFGQQQRLGFATGRRILRLGNAASCVCGNRYGLPAEIPFSWEAFSMAYVTALKVAQKEVAVVSNG